MEDEESLLLLSRAKVKSIWRELKDGQSRIQTVSDVNRELQTYLDWLQEHRPGVYERLIRGTGVEKKPNSGLREIRLEVFTDAELEKFQK